MTTESDEKKPPYRSYAFTNWLNLAFLAGVGVAGAVIDPMVWLLALPIELGALWVIPDLPSFRGRVDQRQRAKDFARERTYYLRQLWGLAPRRKTLGESVLEWFAEVDDENVDSRVLKKDETFQHYSEMRQIIAKLLELETVRGEHIVSNDLNRFEQVINGYLRCLMACRSLSDGLQGIDSAHLKKDITEIETQLKDCSPDLRSVLLERKRLREAQLERLPKLQATLELFRTRADAIVYQMRNIYGQVLADPGANVNDFLEDMMEKHEMMADPLSELEADRVVRELLHAPETGAGGPRRSAIAIQSGKGIRQG